MKKKKKIGEYDNFNRTEFYNKIEFKFNKDFVDMFFNELLDFDEVGPYRYRGTISDLTFLINKVEKYTNEPVDNIIKLINKNTYLVK